MVRDIRGKEGRKEERTSDRVEAIGGAEKVAAAAVSDGWVCCLIGRAAEYGWKRWAAEAAEVRDELPGGAVPRGKVTGREAEMEKS